MQPTFCPFCKTVIPSDATFCPKCGKSIKELTTPISLGKQIGLYIFSILLPPLGLVPGIKYMLGKNPNGKTVGLILIILSIISIGVSLVVFSQVINEINKQVNTQFLQYQNLGL